MPGDCSLLGYLNIQRFIQVEKSRNKLSSYNNQCGGFCRSSAMPSDETMTVAKMARYAG
jgi:hypothetical protein